jgi:hypothetical protein
MLIGSLVQLERHRLKSIEPSSSLYFPTAKRISYAETVHAISAFVNLLKCSKLQENFGDYLQGVFIVIIVKINIISNSQHKTA